MSLFGLAMACEHEVSTERAVMTLITGIQSRIGAFLAPATDPGTRAEVVSLLQQLQAEKEKLAAAVAAAGKS
jgi:hypothetical protein